MLRALQVQNIALIERLELEVQPGFTALTGETGAGKSILLDAVGLLLGSRASGELVRTGANKGIVQGVFDVSGHFAHAVYELCQAEGIELDEEQLIVSREVSTNGKTTARVNSRIVTVQFLRELGRLLIHQHGQHDSISLLRKEEHLALLDAYGGEELAQAKAAYRDAYINYIEYTKQLHNMEQNQRERVQRLDLLQYQMREIEAVQPRVGEEPELRIEQKKLQYGEKLRAVAEEVYEKLYEGSPRIPAIIDEVYHLHQIVENNIKFDDELKELQEYLQTAQVNLSEAADFVRHYKSQLEFDPERLQQVEDRLATLERIFLKYGETAQDVLAFYQEIESEYEKLLHHEETISDLQERLLQAKQALTEMAQRLSLLRRRVAFALEQALAQELDDLLMPKVQLHLQFTETKPSITGIDDVEILFSPNQGETVKPLAKIASGGELSRVMLALVSVLHASAPVPTLIFDEIDTGISGRAAQAVAERIAHLGRENQVLCVTHLPQMACLATHHLAITKQMEEGRTRTFVRPLSHEERIAEIAKMIGGENVSETTRRQAIEMLTWSNAFPSL
ncbi:DNA repair protein RecN [Sulfoacidibacillus thermotolerans]|uniref:DNA repair protein RecN n=1 Tax=Sulfoacidibacillus thermotolerans TaxID=1765684 RepID=A0A2U3DBX1_SULT2|nr:DNA repair protein RecN [Sulfoacidibacillus thermotolerans]PWI58774.1 DNA repair protein RecN [Sulfoacidibacillus thermotolerans]